MQLTAIDLAEFAARVAVHSATNGGLWGLVTATANPAELAHELTEELSYIAGIPARPLRIADTVEATVQTLLGAGDDWAVVFGFSPSNTAIWSGLDQLRNNLQGIAGLVLILSPTDLYNLQVHAPNLSSWLGGRVWRLSDGSAELSPGEVEQRLIALRAAFGKTDAEVVADARRGELPAEPEYAEWLILLGQGGLIT